MKREEGGYIVVETIACFLLFVFLIISILSLINIVTVQARVHYALTQAAETVSMYTYVLDAAGMASHLQANAKKGEEVEGGIYGFYNNINDMLDAFDNLDIDGIKQSGSNAAEQIKGLGTRVTENPESVFKDFLNYALTESIDAAFAGVMKPLLDHYLANGTMSGDEFLRSFGVIDGLDGIKLNELGLLNAEDGRLVAADRSSAFLTGDGDVKLVARYKIDYTFGILPLPFGQLEIEQEVITKSWLSGLGEGYAE